MNIYLFTIIYIQILLCNEKRNSKNNSKSKNYLNDRLNYKYQSSQYFNSNNDNNILFYPHNDNFNHFLQMKNINGVINALKQRLKTLKNRFKILKKIKKNNPKFRKKIYFSNMN